MKNPPTSTTDEAAKQKPQAPMLAIAQALFGRPSRIERASKFVAQAAGILISVTIAAVAVGSGALWLVWLAGRVL